MSRKTIVLDPNGGGPMSTRLLRTNNLEEIKIKFSEIPRTVQGTLKSWQAGRRQVHGGLIFRKLMVCIFDLNSFPVLNNFQVIFGLYDACTATSLSGEKLDQIMFLRENALMANFNLGWQ